MGYHLAREFSMESSAGPDPSNAWQRNAAASTPPDNGRVATALLRRDGTWRWLHVHETWLPPAVMADGPYDS